VAELGMRPIFFDVDAELGLSRAVMTECAELETEDIGWALRRASIDCGSRLWTVIDFDSGDCVHDPSSATLARARPLKPRISLSLRAPSVCAAATGSRLRGSPAL
jgi:hypothetical protein